MRPLFQFGDLVALAAQVADDVFVATRGMTVVVISPLDALGFC